MRLDYESIKQVNLKEVEKIGWRIGNELREQMPISLEVIFSFAYAAYIVGIENCKSADEMWEAISKQNDKEEQYFIKQNIEKNIDDVFALREKISVEDLLKCVIYYSAETGLKSRNVDTPDGISELVLRLLKIKEKECVADFGCGTGNFLVKAILNTDANYYGNDIDIGLKAISRIRTQLLNRDVQIEQVDMFMNADKKQFDKIFSNYTFGMRLRDLGWENEYLDNLLKEIPNVAKATSSDWIFNALLVNCLRDKGKAIGIMTNGSTWNAIDKPIREYFVKNGLIECVISLPGKMFETTAIQTTLIVLSKGNKSIKMVDAHETFQVGRRQNSFSKEDIEKIVHWVEVEGEFSKFVTIEEVAENDFVINPMRYISESITIKDGVEFGEVIKSITRGAQLKASELDELTSQEPTLIQYLMLSNIQEGMIDEQLPYIKQIEGKYKKYCIHNGNMVLSKNGAPFKVAIAEIEIGKEVLGNGNLYIIELDEEKVNPYFLKAFFESELGMASLKNICVGATLPNIPVDALKKMKVPVPPLEQQNVIASKYQAKMNEIKVLKQKLNKAKISLKNIFEEVE